MCGICGFVNYKQGVESYTQIIEVMTRSMTHRGPDEEGIYCQDTVALGSRRLSIIDLSNGQQPISNEDDRYWIVYNGETYNYKELRAHLLHLGHIFKTDSDTEVILHLYEEYGMDSVNYLNGMFAFAIWDRHEESLFIARDRTGIKPLYYTVVDGQLIFGSEMKVLLQHPDTRKKIDFTSLNEYLSYEYVPTPKTIFQNIFRLPAGYMMNYSQRDGLKLHKYWDADFANSESYPPVHWKEFSEGLDQRLASSVKREMVSDVPVGVLLSGGLDSSTVAAYMRQATTSDINSYSISFENESFDESQYARQVAEHLGLNHNDFRLTESMAADLTTNIADFLDEPFADSSLIPTFLLSKYTSQQVKVVMGGDGGDELFAGYPTLIAHRLIEYYERMIPRFVRSNFVPRFIDAMPVNFNNLSFDYRVRRFLSGRGVPLYDRHHRWLGSFIDEQKSNLLQDWIKPILPDSYTPSYLQAKHSDAQEPLNQIMYNDFKMYLEGDILYKVDRASMASSLEVRVPLLNRELVDYVLRLPFNLKLHRFTSKYLLKKTMEDKLPHSIIYRKKKGFNMPVAYWLKGKLREMMFDLLSESTLQQQGLFNPVYVQSLIDDHVNNRKDHRKELWTLIVFQMWYQKYGIDQ